MIFFKKFCQNFSNTKGNIIFFENKGYSFKDIKNIINIFEKKIDLSSPYICIISENNIYSVSLYLLSSKLCKAFVPLDPNISLDENIKIIKNFRINNIFCFSDYSKKLSVNKISNFDLNSVKKENLINKKNNFKSNFFLLSFTSGSTGMAKPIAIDEKTKLLRAKSNINLYSLKQKKKYLISTPLYHTLAIRILNIFILNGSKIYILEKYNFNKFLKYIKRYKIYFTFFIADQLNQILNNNIASDNFRSLKAIVSSSAQLSLINKKKLLKKYKNCFFECYGLSEGAILTSLNLRDRKNNIESVGKPIPGVKIKIKKIAKKKIGEIFFKSKQMFSGYLLKNGNFRKKLSNGYFGTGDIGYIKNKLLYYVGRKKNMIKINGRSIYPEDIESLLKKYNLVKDCAVTSVINADKEEKICLIYVSKYKSENSLNFKKKCINVLPIIYLPRYFIKVSTIPKNKLNKINRSGLKKIADQINE